MVVDQIVTYVSAVNRTKHVAVITEVNEDGTFTVSINGKLKYKVPYKPPEAVEPTVEIRRQVLPQSYVVELIR